MYLSRRYNLYPKADFHLAYKIDSLLNSVDDYLTAYGKYQAEQDGQGRQKALEKWLEVAEYWFRALEKRLSTNLAEGKQYIAGENIAVADYALFTVFHSKVLNSHGHPLPLLKASFDRHANLKAYIESNLGKEPIASFLNAKRL
jgi:glutathione S-transferase